MYIYLYMRNSKQIESQIAVLQRKFDKTLPVTNDGKHNPVYYSLQGKLKQLRKELEDVKWMEHLAQ